MPWRRSKKEPKKSLDSMSSDEKRAWMEEILRLPKDVTEKFKKQRADRRQKKKSS